VDVVTDTHAGSEGAVATPPAPDGAGVPADGATPVDGNGTVEDASAAPRPSRRRRAVAAARDLAAVLLVIATTVHLAGDDGGRPVPTLVPVAVLALGLLPLLAAELARLRRTTVVVVAGLVAGPAIAWALAPIRAGGTRPLLVAAVAVVAFLAARHLWDRPWGPPLLGAVVAVAVGRAWVDAAFAWWGKGMAGGEPMWLALSWHNQSGTLMGAAAVAALAIALVGPRTVRSAALVATGALAAGTWLSGSRGAVLATAVGIAVVVVAARHRGLRHLAATVTVATLLSVAGTAGLLALVEDGEAGPLTSRAQPLTSRDQSAEHNLRARVGHAEAAARMAVAHPLVGTGPGSYRWAARPFYPDDVNLTASAHNEYLEALGETGLVGGLPVAVAALGLAWLVLGVVRDPERRVDGRAAGVLAAAGAVTVLGVHAGADFDWDYALLAALLAIAAAVVHAARGRRVDAPPAARRRAAWLGGAALGCGVALAVALGTIEVTQRPAAPPWSLTSATGDAVVALRAGEVEDATAALDRMAAWNPGSGSLVPLRALTALVAGDGSADEVVAAIDPRSTPNPDQLLAAQLLIEHGHLDAAEAVLDALDPVLQARARWGVERPQAAVAELRARIAALR
jgi:O-antigen ligase